MQRMSSAHELGAHQGAFCVKYSGIYLFQGIASQIVVAVACGCGKMDITDTAFLHGVDDLQLIVLCPLIDLLKARF